MVDSMYYISIQTEIITLTQQRLDFEKKGQVLEFFFRKKKHDAAIANRSTLQFYDFN